MRNDIPKNHMESYACPKCGQREELKLTGASQTVDILLTDDGTVEIDSREITWEDETSCECLSCWHAGTIKDFEIST